MATHSNATPLFKNLEPCAQTRWGERTDVDLPVTLKIAGSAPVPGRLRNVSISGALIATAAPLPLRSVIEVAVGQQEFPASVVRNAEGLVGIEWSDMKCPQLLDLLQALDGSTQT